MDYNTYNKLINEYFDIKDATTRKVLVSLTEADEQNQALLSASIKLYDMIQDKVTEIDFGEIPQSRGDITKIPNYPNLIECIDTIHTLLLQYKQSTDVTEIVSESIENMKVLRPEWEKAFVINCDILQVLYNTISLSIVSSVSYLISTCIDFVRDPQTNTYELSLDRVAKAKSKDHLLFKNLKKFNNACKKGQMKKSMDEILKASRSIGESTDLENVLSEEYDTVNEFTATAIITAIAGTAAVISLLTILLPLIQELVCFLYCTRQSVSDYFSIQADIVRLNAENVKMGVTKTPAEKDKIYKRQEKIADTLKKISTKLAVKMKGSNKEAEKMIEKERKEKRKFQPIDPSISPSSIF